MKFTFAKVARSCRYFLFRFFFADLSPDPDYDPKEARKLEKELQRMESKKDGERKVTLKGFSKAVSLAAKLSPKSQRHKDKRPSNIAELKVGGMLRIPSTHELQQF